MNNFKIGDIVLFSWKPNYAPWRKGKIVAISNNVSMSNPANFVGKPEYYVSAVDSNNNTTTETKSYTGVTKPEITITVSADKKSADISRYTKAIPRRVLRIYRDYILIPITYS